MTDTRPSENTDKPFAAVAEYGRTHLAWGRTETPADTEQDPIEDLIERAQNANDPGFGLVLAQLATVRAVQAQTEQARIANIIALANVPLTDERVTVSRAEQAAWDALALRSSGELRPETRKVLGL